MNQHEWPNCADVPLRIYSLTQTRTNLCLLQQNCTIIV